MWFPVRALTSIRTRHSAPPRIYATIVLFYSYLVIVLQHYRHLMWLNLTVSAMSLADSVTVIPTVAVTAAPTDNSVPSLDPAETTTLTQQQIQNNAATSLSTLLQTGLNARITYNSGNNAQPLVSFRGFGDNAQSNSLIVVDGFPLLNASLLAPNFNAIALTDIQKITLFQGSQGALWGDQAVGGVMAIQTIHPTKPQGEVSMAYGSYNTPFLSGFYSDRLAHGIFYKVSAFGTNTDNYRDHNQQADNGIDLEEGLDYATGSLVFKQKVNTSTLHFPGSLTAEQYQTDLTQATDTQDYIRYQTQIYQVLNQQLLNEHWRLETRFSTTQVDGSGWFYAPFNESENTNWFNPQLIGAFHGYQWTLGYVGATSHYQDSTDSDATSSAADSTEQDIYAESVIPLTPQWVLTLGARSAWQQNTPQITLGQSSPYSNRAFVTEQGIQFHLNRDWTWFLRRDGNFRFPKADEQVWVSSDSPELKAQTGTSYETGVSFKNRRQQWQLSVYELWLANELAYDPTQTANQPFGSSSNFDTTLRKGISLTQSTDVSESLIVDTHLNYLNANFIAGAYAGNDIPAVPHYNASLGAQYQFAPHWHTRYQESYTGSSYASDDVSNNSPKTAAYWLAQWSLGYARKSWQVNFQINNLFNQRYAIYTVYDQTTQANSYYPGTGRNLNLNAKVQWA